MKKLINKPEDVVTEELQGIAAAHPDLVKVYFNPNFIVRADAPVEGKVGIVSGGGSGHEPMHGGFVGPGMLDAACPGEGFTSPTPDEVLAFVNSMGGTPSLELYVVYNDLQRLLGERGITITRNLIGPFITSLEMAGCSITLLKLDDELKRLWDAPVKTAGLRWGA